MRISERDSARDIALRCPDGAARRPYRITTIVIAICLLAVTARLVLIDQPYVDHWSWRQNAIENLARLRRGGATHFVFTRNTFWWLRSYPEFAAHLANNATLIEATPQFQIYELLPLAK